MTIVGARGNKSATVTQVHRYLSLVRYLSERESAEVAELAMVAGVSRASIYRILHEVREALGVVIETDGENRARLVSSGVVCLRIS